MIKKIVICLNTSWNIYNFRLNLARALQKKGYHIILVSPKDEYSEKLENEFEYYDIYINNKGTNPFEDIKTMWQFYQLYKRINPSLVLNYTVKPNIYGNIVCNILGIKTINNISGLGSVFIQESLVTKVVKQLYRYSLSKSSKVFFQNDDDKKLFIKYKLVNESQCGILPGSGVDIIKFKPIEYKRKEHTCRFLFISRMLFDKGVQEYIDATRILCKKYQTMEFQLLGPLDVANSTAVTKEQMQVWIKEGIVTYLGTTDDVREYIKKADCIVLPSYREGTPRTLLESASMEKPIITTNTIGCKDVVDDSINGFLCEVKNATDLANKMEKFFFLTNKDKKIMGKKGREKMIRIYDEKIVIEKYLKVIQRL